VDANSVMFAAQKKQVHTAAMQTPPYLHQQSANSCSLACLAMVLSWLGQDVSEMTLREVITVEYGKVPKHLLSASIARLAKGLGVKVTLRATLPLLQPKLADETIAYYGHHEMERLELPITYAETLRALEAGCASEYGELDRRTIIMSLASHSVIQATVRLAALYPERSLKGHHSILLYETDGDTVRYHDPEFGAALSVDMDQLLTACHGTGAVMIYAASTSPHAR
jgi:hypothetical protein